MIDNLPIPAWMRDLWTRPVDRLGRWHRAMRYSVELAVHGAKELRHDRATQMAAALTYHTLFSLLPTIVLAMVILHTFVAPAEREGFKKSVVEQIIPQQVAVNATPEAAAARNEIAARVGQIMESLERVSFGGIGTIGLLVFIYAATGLLATVERSFNTIYGISQARPWYLRLPMYYTVITLGPVVLIAAQALQAFLFRFFSEGSWTNWIVGPAALVAPLMLAWLLFFIMFTLLPNTRVGKRSSAIGSFVAAVLWVVSKDLFSLYVRHASASFYGALGLLPLFLFWLYITWLIVLFGVEIAHTLSAMSSGQFKHLESTRTNDNFVDSAWVVPLMARVAAAFAQGKTIAAEELARALNLPSRSVRQLIVVLEKQGLIHAVHHRESIGFTLSRPADRIELQQLIDAVESLIPRGAATADDPAWRTVQQLHDTHRAALGRRTLADLLSA
jgi:membrane protein